MAGLSSYKRILAPNRPESIGARGNVIILRNSAAALVTVIARSTRVGSVSGLAYKLDLRPGEAWDCATEFDSVEVSVPEEALVLDVEAYPVELLIGYGNFRALGAPSRRPEIFQTVEHTGIAQLGDATLIVERNAAQWRALIQNKGNVPVIVADTHGQASVGAGVLLNAGSLDGNGLPTGGGSMTVEGRGELWASAYSLGELTSSRLTVLLELFLL